MSDDKPTFPPVDFDFLRQQTFGDTELEREVLQLFVAQARRILPTLPHLAPQAQADAAHLLKGSARGIGAWAAADSAEKWEQADARERADGFDALSSRFAAAEAAILARLDQPLQ